MVFLLSYINDILDCFVPLLAGLAMTDIIFVMNGGMGGYPGAI